MILRGARRRTAGVPPPAAGMERAAPQRSAPSPASVIPFDYAARFRLKGVPGALHQDVINVSPDGVFVGVGLSYGFEADRTRADIDPLRDVPNKADPVLPLELKLAQLPLDALIHGFRVNPKMDHLVFPPPLDASGAPAAAAPSATFEKVPLRFVPNLFQQFITQEPLSFLFNFVDTGTGRELQDEPMHNIASLGIASGDRPFRMLARPVTFLPRSNLRLQVIEQSAGTTGMLHIVLFGYKMLGAGHITEAEARFMARSASRVLTERPRGPVIPFDYVTTFDLTGKPGNTLTDEFVVSVEGGFRATAIGYGLQAASTEVKLEEAVANPLRDAGGGLDLGKLPLKAFAPDVLRDGIRLRRGLLRLAMDSSGTLAQSLPKELWHEVFERICSPEAVQFRYIMHDSARGQDFQNQPVFNIAGLGIADGSRPFRSLTPPLHVLPRATLRVTVEEGYGRGRLFIVFQGYKVLGRGT